MSDQKTAPSGETGISTRSGHRVRRMAAVSLLALLLASFAMAADGELDPSFNGSGFRITDHTTATNDVGRNVFYQADGKIVVVGQMNQQLCALRYLSDGQLDATFSGDGIACANVGANNVGWTGAIQDDGKVVVAGTTDTGGQAGLVRFDVNGDLDAAFGTGGRVTTNFGGGGFRFGAVLIQPDGKVVLVGFHDPAGADSRDIIMSRYEADGTPDATFGSSGIVSGNLSPGGFEEAYDAELLPSGKILVAGRGLTPGGSVDILVVRYNTDGTPDTTFDSDGYLLTDVAPGSSDLANSISLGLNGRILVGGSATIGSQTPVLVRYLSDGTLDTSFDGDGIRIFAGGGAGVTDAIVQSDGKIIAAMTTSTGQTVVKLTNNGIFDGTFGTGGSGTFILPGALQLASQADGKILTTGARLVGGSNAVFTARLLNTVSLLPPSSGPVTVSGRVTDSRGRAIGGATVTLVDAEGNARTVRSASFGYFTFTNVRSGRAYILTVSAKRYRFSNATRLISPAENITDAHFTADH